jgi:hypothetical protein
MSMPNMSENLLRSHERPDSHIFDRMSRFRPRDGMAALARTPILRKTARVTAAPNRAPEAVAQIGKKSRRRSPLA